MSTRKKKSPASELPPGMLRALSSRKQSADSDSLLTDLVEIWGGTRQLAKDLYSEFQRAQAGGQTRQKILDMIARLIQNNTNHNIGKSVQPSDLTDEELQAVALEYARRVSGVGNSEATS